VTTLLFESNFLFHLLKGLGWVANEAENGYKLVGMVILGTKGISRLLEYAFFPNARPLFPRIFLLIRLSLIRRNVSFEEGDSEYAQVACREGRGITHESESRIWNSAPKRIRGYNSTRSSQ